MRSALLGLAVALVLAGSAIWMAIPTLTPLLTREGAALEVPASSSRLYSMGLQKGDTVVFNVVVDGGPLDLFVVWVYAPPTPLAGEGGLGGYFGKPIRELRGVEGRLSFKVEADARGAYFLRFSNPDDKTPRQVAIERFMERSVTLEKYFTFLRDVSFFRLRLSAFSRH